MWQWLRELDQVLRGETTRLAVLRSGKIDVSIGGLSAVLLVLSMLYGFFMGWFALFNREAPEYRQVVAAMVKVPALFFLGQCLCHRSTHAAGCAGSVSYA
jgi:hypothetical protein